MKKVAISINEITTLINLAILAPAVMPGTAVFFQTIYKFGVILLCGLLKGLFTILVILEDGLRYCVPTDGICFRGL